MMCYKTMLKRVVAAALLAALAGCAARSSDIYRAENMDFGSIQTVAVLPFGNASRDQTASERVRDVFVVMLLASNIYVVPQGEVVRGINTLGITNPVAPSTEEVTKLATFLKADAVITGLLREYGEVRSASSAANVVSMSLQMFEAKTGQVVWSASTTKGGITMKERLLGGGGQPMNVVTEKAVNEILDKLFH